MQSEKDTLIERYASDAFKNRNNPDLPLGVWRQHFVEFAEKLEAALSAAEPVSYQRKTVYGWREVDAADIPHYRSVGQEIRGLYAAPPAPSVAVKALEWKEDGKYLRARMGDREYSLNITSDGETWAGCTRPYVFGHNLTWSSVPNCSMVSLDAAKAACQADCQSRYAALSAQVQDVATARDALHAIANLPTGKNIDVCQGHEEAYRAVEALFSTPPKIQVQDVAKPDDELFWRLRIAYKRGAEWRDTTGSMHLVDKASYDYADKITSPLPAAPAKQEGGE